MPYRDCDLEILHQCEERGLSDIDAIRSEASRLWKCTDMEEMLLQDTVSKKISVRIKNFAEEILAATENSENCLVKELHRTENDIDTFRNL